jgi:predicted amidophosphoribosyltransferase
MYTQTKSQIFETIKKKSQVQVKDLVKLIGITQAAIHRHLNKLLSEGLIERKGTPPSVFYTLTKNTENSQTYALDQVQLSKLKEYYLYIDPTGKSIEGIDGFLQWMRSTNNKQKIENCVNDYISILNEALSYKKEYNLIDATERFKKIFSNFALDKVYYFDFYSLIKFGKTKIGQLLHHGKQAQDKKTIQLISVAVQKQIQDLIRLEKIEAILWVPHSIPRKVPFLKEVEKNLNLNLPKIEVKKAYSDGFPIAQKSLSKLEERIINARETMMLIPMEIKHKNVLIIDDAVGSGATLVEIAKKLKDRRVKKIIGFSIVGSYKGFEVIKEV